MEEYLERIQADFFEPIDSYQIIQNYGYKSYIPELIEYIEKLF